MALGTKKGFYIDGSTKLINTYYVAHTFASEFIVSEMTILNQNTVDATIRLAFVPGGQPSDPPDEEDMELLDEVIAAKTSYKEKGACFAKDDMIVLYSTVPKVSLRFSGDAK